MNDASARTKDMSLSDILRPAKLSIIRENEYGYIFTDENLASNWDNVDVQPESLQKGEAD
jgi:hypothetical protein